MCLIYADFWDRLAEIEAESIGRTKSEPGVYLHVSDRNVTKVLASGVP